MLKGMSHREITQALRKQGCEVVFDRGSHTKWVCSCDEKHTANIPRHQMVSPGGVRNTITRLGLSEGGTAPVTTYNVTAKRWGNYWELHIDGIGVTQARTLGSAERMVREYLELDEKPDAMTATIVVTPVLDGNLASEAEAARDAVRQAEKARSEASVRLRDVARRLKEAGLSGADMAAVLHVSTQRVSQLVNS